MDRRIWALVPVFLILAVSSIMLAAPVEGADGDGVLVDLGNGDTAWAAPEGGTVELVLKSAAEACGHEAVFDGKITIDGLSERTTGTVKASWRVYSWADGSWSDVTSTIDLSSAYVSGSYALGFYPEGISPTETPDHRSSWTMIRGDSANTGHQTAQLSEENGSVAWIYKTVGTSNFVNAAMLVEGDNVYAVAGGGFTSSQADPALYCFDRFTGEEKWHFQYSKGAGYETATGVIVGGYYFLPATEGKLYRIPLTGPGTDDSEVVSIDIPKARDHTLTGMMYSTGSASIVYDSGVLYFGSSNGHVYCVDTDLNIIWNTQIGGCVYYMSPTVCGEYILIGSLDGHLYSLDRTTGAIIDSALVHQTTETVGSNEKIYGQACVPVLVGDRLMLSFSNGKGMDTTEGGIAVYSFVDGMLTQISKEMTGVCSTFVTPYEDAGFFGIYYLSGDTMYRYSVSGTSETVYNGKLAFKGPLTIVNNEMIFVAEYEKGGSILVTDMEGKLLGSVKQPSDVESYAMAPTVVIDGMVYLGTDAGAFSYQGMIGSASPSSDDDSRAGMDLGSIIGIVVLIVIIILVIVFVQRWRASGIPLLAYININLRKGSETGGSKVRRNKRRLAIVLLIGAVLAVLMFVISLAFGPSGSYGFRESLSLLASAMGKAIDSQPIVDNDEIVVFNSRCCRAVAAFAAGLGLSVAGAMYQAIIRNPMVDPYIMGVSAGAGVAAVATIAFNFTFFGLFDNVTYITPIVAMIGGVIAFSCTMFLAEKAGGSSINYVLAGIIIGLVFSAVQTLLLSMAGDKLHDAMTWLFGSFANIGWTEAILMTVPAISMSLISLVWAKEFNLVLLGEDQARQMGLDVRRFNKWMLILASVLASVCVAFVGIIGFVGLVVPHLCRMILGGDHRLVLPASMVIGGVLMMAADFFAKMVMVPMELPVGAITTVIGAPVFAYLLIKKGRMYDG